MTMHFVGVSLVAFLTAGTALADVCPDDIPADSGLRRAQAKKWFAKGDEATNSGDDLAALKAFQSSLKFVPHGFTAYNIGQVAERIGDLEMAIASYKQYLLLVPDATDGQEVTRKINLLKERLAQVRASDQDLNPLIPGGAAPAARDSAASAPGASAPATYDKPTESVRSDEEATPPSHVFAWVAFGSTAVLLAAGVVTNLAARSKMDTCNRKWPLDPDGAKSACSDASPLAYSSYGLFAAGAVAAAVGTVLYLRPTQSSTVAMGVLPEGGLSLRLRGQF